MFHCNFRVPITIHPSFWVLALLLAFLNSSTIVEGVFWVFIVFISVLVHEYGHALAALCFNQNPKIELVASGGLTSYQGEKPFLWKEFHRCFKRPSYGFCSLFCGLPSFKMGIFYISWR